MAKKIILCPFKSDIIQFVFRIFHNVVVGATRSRVESDRGKSEEFFFGPHPVY